jgi:hypothetical protein
MMLGSKGGMRADDKQTGNRLEVIDLAVTLRARDRLALPETMRGSILRGAFSLAFRRLVCVDPTLRLDCNDCSLHRVCPWPEVFRPAPTLDSERLRLASDLPRPFVVKPEVGGPCEHRAGETVGFRLAHVSPERTGSAW